MSEQFEWTPERRKRAMMYAGPTFDQPRTVEEDALREYSGAEWSLDEFRAILDSVPAEYAASAKVVFEYGWEDSASLKVTYVRPESWEEVADHVERVVSYVLECEAKERAEYERLKRKFA